MFTLKWALQPRVEGRAGRACLEEIFKHLSEDGVILTAISTTVGKTNISEQDQRLISRQSQLLLSLKNGKSLLNTMVISLASYEGVPFRSTYLPVGNKRSNSLTWEVAARR